MWSTQDLVEGKVSLRWQRDMIFLIHLPQICGQKHDRGACAAHCTVQLFAQTLQSGVGMANTVDTNAESATRTRVWNFMM